MQRYAIIEENHQNVIIKLIEPENVSPDIAEQFISEGFQLMEIEQGWDKQYYLPGESPTIPQDYYKSQRMTAYPDFSEYLDAQVKINSGNAELLAEGQQQLQNYFSHCLSVKSAFPKPEVEN